LLKGPIHQKIIYIFSYTLIRSINKKYIYMYALNTRAAKPTWQTWAELKGETGSTTVNTRSLQYWIERAAGRSVKKQVEQWTQQAGAECASLWLRKTLF
jgi:hypothetical protein